MPTIFRLSLISLSFSLAAVTLPATAQIATLRQAEALTDGATIDVLGEGKLKVPPAFKKGQPRSRIVQAEYVASLGDGARKQDARVYGMASGGGVEPNVARWKGQFSAAPAGAFKRESMTIGNWKIELVDHAGTFNDSMGGGPFAGGKTVKREDYAMTGAILQNRSGQLFFLKMIGPAKVVKANRDDFVKMIKSIGDS